MSSASIAAITTKTTRIYIVGPSSTGKTTLCAALARRLELDPGAHIREVARDVMHRTGYSRHTVSVVAMQRAILGAQLAREEEVAATIAAAAASPPGDDGDGGGRLPRVLLSDRSAVDPVVYAVLTAPSEADAVERQQDLTGSPEFQRALGAYHRSLFVLLRPVPGWLVDDGVRLMNEHERCLEVFREVLSALEIPFREMGSEVVDLEERVDVILGYTESLKKQGAQTGKL